MKRNLLVVILLISRISLTAQSVPVEKRDWWGDVDGFYNQQARISLEMVDKVLKSNPPDVNESTIRKMALLLIDNVLHVEQAAQLPSVQDFFRRHVENAIMEIRNTKVMEGAMIWKLYNHAFVVKTNSLTIGFDIQDGLSRVKGFQLDNSLLEQLAEDLDILFISHYHGDHANAKVAEMFLARNKPVVSPAGLWNDLPIYDKILHPERKAHIAREITLPEKGFNLKTVIYPGHQGTDIINNVYLVIDPSGLSFAHTGDQSNAEDLKWIENIKDFHSVNVLMVNSWGIDRDSRLISGFSPQLIIGGHENEMGHSVDHREPYWLNYSRLGSQKISPWVHITWGEKYNYQPVK